MNRQLSKERSENLGRMANGERRRQVVEALGRGLGKSVDHYTRFPFDLRSRLHALNFPSAVPLREDLLPHIAHAVDCGQCLYGLVGSEISDRIHKKVRRVAAGD